MSALAMEVPLALASLEKVGEEYLVDTLQNEWPLRTKLESEDRKLKFDWLQFINKESMF
jgi:hypothetical protein